jgi:hypothetical protein
MDSGYQVIHETSFDDELTKIKGSFERADDFMLGVAWRLSRNPYLGHYLGDRPLWCVSDRSLSNNKLYILYTINEAEKKVFLKSVVSVPIGED